MAFAHHHGVRFSGSKAAMTVPPDVPLEKDRLQGEMIYSSGVRDAFGGRHALDWLSSSRTPTTGARPPLPSSRTDATAGHWGP